MPLSTRDFKKILLIKPSSLGDVIHALPVLNGLRQRYPDAHIAWLLNREYEVLLRNHPQLDEIIPFDRQALRSVVGAGRWTLALGGYVRALRRRSFDLAIDLQGLLKSGLLAAASGSPVRLGFKPSREGSGMFYNHRVVVPAGTLHAVDRNYLVAGALGFQDVPVSFSLPVCPQARQAVRDRLADRLGEVSKPYAVVIPGSRWETKNWFPDRFAEAADVLTGQFDLTAVLSGSPAEAALCARVASICRSPVVDLAGQLSLPELVALIDGATVVLCNDSAPLHVAAALNRPLVTLFGPTHPGRTGPYGGSHGVLSAPLPCSPCYLRRLAQCGFQHQCMKDITVQQVREALRGAVASH